MTRFDKDAPARRPRSGWGPWRIAGAAGFGIVTLSGFTSGWGGALLGASLYLGVTAVWSLVRRRSWLGPMRRRGSAILLACGFVGLVVGSASATPSQPVAGTGGASASVRASSAPATSAAPRPATTPTATMPTATMPTATMPTATMPTATTPTATASVPATGTSARPQTALATVALLDVKGRAPKTGYTRARYGPAWMDVDRNGCDTRNDILRRDLTAIVLKPSTEGCVVATGTLHDPYSGTSIAFVRGVDTSSAVQIDHVVALSDSWQKGAQAWDLARREAFANDPLNLLAVDGPLNTQKSDGDAATWLPPNKSYRCAYVARQVAVKHAYGLWVTPAERDAMVRVLSTCPDEPLPTGSAVPPPAASGAAQPAPAAAPPAPAAPAAAAPAAPAVTLPFANCAAAWAAGAAPVHRGDPGYAPKLDRDNDGIGCEERP